MSPDLLAALSEGQRAIAHLVVVLALLAVGGVAFLIRRTRRRNEAQERQRISEQER
jgi:cbb3-type cytochrome oxidase subunit 3